MFIGRGAAQQKCSTMGPRERTGKNVNAPTIKITPTSNPTNRGVWTGKVPADEGAAFLLARLPAMAIMGIIMKNRPNSIANPRVVLYQ